MKQYEVVLEVTKKYFAIVDTRDSIDSLSEAEEKALCGNVNSFTETGERIKICSVTKVMNIEG